MTKHTVPARIALFMTLAALAPLAAQTGGGGAALLNVGEYSKLFLNSGGVRDSKYTRAASRENRALISALSGDEFDVDTPLEIALLSTCAGVIDIRPAEADALLPKNNPKLTDTRLGAAAYMEMQVLRFLGNTDAVGRHEGIIKFITDRGNITHREIETFYYGNIGASITEIVNEQFKNTLLPPNEIQAVKVILTNFSLKPDTDAFNAVRDVYYIYSTAAISSKQKIYYTDIAIAYSETLSSFGVPELSSAILKDIADNPQLKSGVDNVVALAKTVQQYIR